MRLLNESGERAQEHQEWRAKGEADVEATSFKPHHPMQNVVGVFLRVPRCKRLTQI